MSNGQLYRLFLYLKKLYSEGPPPGSIGGDIYIMCLGASGCGSSTFINNLIQGSAKASLPRMEVEDSLSSCTKVIQWTEVAPAGDPAWARNYNFLFGDTPGFDSTDPNLTDAVIADRIKKSLEDRLGGLERPSQLGILLLQDVTEDVPRLLALIGNVNTQIHGQVLKNTTVVTNKWSIWAGKHNGDPESSQATLPSPTPGPSEEMIAHQDKITECLSAHFPADVVAYDANWVEGDEWRIVEGLVNRVVTGNCVLQLEPDSSAPVTRSWFSRWFGWMICWR